jgi:hypothetical protein
MFSLGILAIFQVLFFPGLIIKKFVKLPKNIFFLISSIIAFSLIFNYLFVFFMTGIGIFVRWLVLILIAIEFGFLLFLYKNEIREINLGKLLLLLWNSLSKSIHSLFPTVEDQDNKFLVVLRNIFLLISFIIALIAIEWMSRFFRHNIGEVFNTWDAVVSWNRWAVNWASNQFPLRTEDYPQLIPANWAMIYKISGTSQIQLFSKAIMPLFPLLILLLLFGLGFETKNPAFFLSIEVARLIIKKFSGEFISAGYVDFALSFFIFLAFTMLYLSYKSKILNVKLNYIFLSLIFVSGSVVTKQPGFFGLFSIFGISIFLILRGELKTILSEYKKQIFILSLIIIIIVIPWYLYKGIQIILGIETTHLLGALNHTNQVHNNQSLFANLLPGLKTLGNYFYLVLFIIPSLFVIEKFWRVIAIFVVLPYVALWASYASYDPRNLTMMYPFIALLFCLGLFGFVFLFLSFFQKIKFEKISLFLFILIFGIVIISLNFVFSKNSLEARQLEKQKMIFSAELNTKLYDYFSNREMSGKILTNYPVDYLPGFENSQVSFNYDELNYLINRLFVEEIGYLLYPSNLSDEVQEYIIDLESQGLINQVFETDSWIPYKFAIINK